MMETTILTIPLYIVVDVKPDEQQKDQQKRCVEEARSVQHHQ